MTIKIYEAKTDRIEGRNSSAVIAGDFSIPLTTMDRTTRQSIRRGFKQHKLTRSNRHIQNTVPNNRIHVLLKCMWDIFQDRLYVRPQIKIQ